MEQLQALTMLLPQQEEPMRPMARKLTLDETLIALTVTQVSLECKVI